MSVGNISQKPPAAGAHAPTATMPSAAPGGAPARKFRDVMAQRPTALPGGPAGALPVPVLPSGVPAAAHALLGPPGGHALDPRALERTRHADQAHAGSRPEDDALDAHARQAAQLAPPLLDMPVLTTTTVVLMQAVHQASLEALLPQLVRHIAWSKDGARKGTVRMEFGAGALAGGSMVVHADNGKVAVQLDVPAGQDHAAWQTRIRAALERRGIHASDIEIS